MENKCYNDYSNKNCESKIITSKTLPEFPNEFKEPHGISGPLVAKIPVVISELKMQIDVESEIKLEEPALEIKRIKKNLFLTECKLVCVKEPKQEDEDDKKWWPDSRKEECCWGKLFIKGFVRKNIEYATLKSKCSDKGCISGDIRHTTCNVPFICVTKVHFVRPPVFNRSANSSEAEIFAAKFNPCDPCAEPIIGRDPCQQEFRHFETFNEKVFCELESAKIFEEDIQTCVTPVDRDCSYEHVFDTITEKMVIFFKLKLLQNQQVKIPKCEDDNKSPCD